MQEEQIILNHSTVVEDSGEECQVRNAEQCEQTLQEWIQLLLMDKEEVYE
jgi:hypothetical protein